MFLTILVITCVIYCFVCALSQQSFSENEAVSKQQQYDLTASDDYLNVLKRLHNTKCTATAVLSIDQDTRLSRRETTYQARRRQHDPPTFTLELGRDGIFAISTFDTSGEA